MSRPFANKRGFTLTELLVVVAIIVLLTSIVLPNLVGRIPVSRMHAAEDQIAEIETALAAYHADFGEYPADVFPTEDRNNNGVLDEGEDAGVDIDGDGVSDYACNTDGTAKPNGRLDHGDGVINILDLEWALKTTNKNGPYMESIPLDPWGHRYVYYAPSLPRPVDTADFLHMDYEHMRDEDGASGSVPNGRLEPGEDIGIAQYDTTNGDVATGFINKWAGAGNKILDHSDDMNKNGTIETHITVTPVEYFELAHPDRSPDGLAMNIGYYIYCLGRDGRDSSATGYEDIKQNGILNDGGSGLPAPSGHADLLTTDTGTFNEDINTSGNLNCGYEDVGLDGIPGTHDYGENDWDTANNPTIEKTASDPPGIPSEEFGTNSNPANLKYWYNTQHTPGQLGMGANVHGFDIGGDDINSWNKARPWRKHNSYGG